MGAQSKGVVGSARAGADSVLRYFRDSIILGEGYPWDLMLAHCVKAIVSWRAFCELHDGKEVGSRASLYSFVCAFFCAGFGGTHFRDWAMGLTPSSFTNPDLPKAWLLAFGLVYYAPFDLVFKLAETRRTLSSAILTTFEAIDSATTLCGSVEKGRRLFPDAPQAPFLAAVLAGVGGSIFRYLERKLGRGWEGEETEWSSPTETTKRTILYTCAYIVLSRAHGGDKARLWVTSAHIALCLYRELV
jgi:hypothetical protein